MSDSRLTNYAFIAGSALAAAGSAGADIITSTGSTTIAQSPPPGAAGWNTLFSIGQVDVRARNLLDNSANNTNPNRDWYMSAQIGGNFGFAHGTAAISNGMTISSGLNLQHGSVGAYRGYDVNNNVGSLTFTDDDLSAGSNKLLAFRVAEGTDTFYGWIDYTLSFTDIFSGSTFTVNAWAYNDVSGQGIIAGQNTAAGSQAVPGLGGLAALAIGAAGVRSRRQRTVA